MWGLSYLLQKSFNSVSESKSGPPPPIKNSWIRPCVNSYKPYHKDVNMSQGLVIGFLVFSDRSGDVCW